MLPLGWLGTSFDVLAMEETGQIFLCLGPSCSLSDTRERRGPAMWSSPALPPSMPFLCLFLTPLLSGVLAFHFPSSSSSFWLEPFLGSSIAPVLEQVSHLPSIRVLWVDVWNGHCCLGPALVPARLLFSPGLLYGGRRVEAGSDSLEESQPSAQTREFNSPYLCTCLAWRIRTRLSSPPDELNE